jgi:parallel beta-helix repeat protein
LGISLISYTQINLKTSSIDEINQKFKIFGSNHFNELTKSDPISISSNDDFGPLKYNFPGTGTIDNPYIISNFYIQNSSLPLIYIVGTTVHFVIENNYLDSVNGEYEAISFAVVKNSIIRSNMIINAMFGILMGSSSNNEIFNNILTGCGTSIWLPTHADNNSIIKNNITNSIKGIDLFDSDFNKIEKNLVLNVSTSIYLFDAINNTVNQNLFAFNNESAIIVTYLGINNTFEHNSIVKNSIGLQISGDNVRNNIFKYNSFMSFDKDFIIQKSSNSSFEFNDFYENNNNLNEVLFDSINDDGTIRFMGNYFSNWISPDLNNDSIVDSPFIIPGNGECVDYEPKTNPNNKLDSIVISFDLDFDIPNPSNTNSNEDPNLTYVNGFSMLVFSIGMIGLFLTKKIKK